MSQVETEDTVVARIIAANSQIPASGCRAQHATDGGHYKATFEVHDLTGTDLAHGLFAEAARYPALIRYSNGKEQDASKPDVHGMAIKVLAPKGERLLTDPDDARAIDFVLIDVDTFFSDDLGDYTLVNEHLVPLLQRKQVSEDEFSFWEALGGLISTVFSIRLVDDALRLFRFRGDKEPVEGVERWDLEYSSATPYQLGTVGPVKYKVLASTGSGSASTAQVTFCIEKPRDPQTVNVEEPSKSWRDLSETFPVATIVIDLNQGPELDAAVDRMRFNPWHVPPAHTPLGAINAARKPVYSALADKRQKELGPGS